MKNPIYICLWFDKQAREASEFYCSLFENSKMKEETPLIVSFELDGINFIGLNGGPHFSFTPSISMFVTCENDEEIIYLWEKLSNGGRVIFPLGKYNWSEHYGWCADKYGLTWQVFKGKLSDVKQKVVPLLLFTDKQFGNAENAIKFYTSLIRNSSIQGILHYGKDAPEAEGSVLHSQFVLDTRVFMAMDGPGDHGFAFNEAVSFVVECESQDEIDYYWNAITKAGEESMCGWCRDEFGVSWQIIPAKIKELMADPEKGGKVMEALLKMKKIDLKILQQV